MPAGRATWVDVPCLNLTRQALRAHASSASHQSAVELEVNLASSKATGGIRQAFSHVVSAERKAMIRAMRCMYWLCKEEVAHTTKFSSLQDLAISLGATYLKDLDLGRNAHYTSKRFMEEAVSALAETVRNKIFEDLRRSPFFSLMADETTDVAVIKEVIVYARYLNSNREIQTAFIGMVEVKEGTASAIMAALEKVCNNCGVNLKKLVAFGSDGASVMIGRHRGVTALLKAEVPWLLANHCVAHRLALAAAQAADEIPSVRKFQAILGQMYRFYSYSGVRMAGLKDIQDFLNNPRLKLTQAKDVRWLSHEKAVSNLRRCLPAVLCSLEREAAERHDCQALGLVTFMKKVILFLFSLL